MKAEAQAQAQAPAPAELSWAKHAPRRAIVISGAIAQKII